tara:strand:- start:6386 stop:7384 length:999 start_codon:yes stop_codon:yes gene_type:complete
MKSDPKISVLMPVYNDEEYILEAIESILNQTYINFEFIIVNDGSTDNSLKIIQSFNDKRIKIINNDKNRGIAYSLNKGLDIVECKYIARIDANDVAHPTRLAVQKEYLDQNEVDLVGTNYIVIDKNSSIIRYGSIREFDPDETQSYLAFYNICHSSIMIRHSRLSHLDKIYNNVLVEDFDLYQRLSYKSKFFIINENLMKIRKLDTGLSSDFKKLEKQIDLLRIQQLKEINLYPNNEQKVIHSNLVNKYFEQLEHFSLASILSWIRLLIYYNNKTEFYSIKYFNKEWYIRINNLFKLRKNKTIVEIYKYSKIIKLMDKKVNLYSLLSYYFKN